VLLTALKVSISQVLYGVSYQNFKLNKDESADILKTAYVQSMESQNFFLRKSEIVSITVQDNLANGAEKFVILDQNRGGVNVTCVLVLRSWMHGFKNDTVAYTYLSIKNIISKPVLTVINKSNICTFIESSGGSFWR